MMMFEVDEQTELKPLTTRHADELHRLVRDHREWLLQWFRWPAEMTSVEAARLFIERMHDRRLNGEALAFGLFADGRMAGVIELAGAGSPDRSGRINCWLAPTAGGRGRMTRACELIAQWAFEEAGLNRLEIRAAADNKRGRALAERLGFRLEGIARQAKRLNGRFADMAVYAMLAAEWREMSRLARHIGY